MQLVKHLPGAIQNQPCSGARQRQQLSLAAAQVMSQQTQLPRVIDYFQRWTQRWPNVAALAAATQDEARHLLCLLACMPAVHASATPVHRTFCKSNCPWGLA